MKSVTSFPIERAIQKLEREKIEILSIILHIVLRFSAGKRERKRRILYHFNAVVIDAIYMDVHAASTGALGAISSLVIDAVSKDGHAASTGAQSATSSVVFDAATDVHGFFTGVRNAILTGE